jgi:hypothetical protein
MLPPPVGVVEAGRKGPPDPAVPVPAGVTLVGATGLEPVGNGFGGTAGMPTVGVFGLSGEPVDVGFWVWVVPAEPGGRGFGWTGGRFVVLAFCVHELPEQLFSASDAGAVASNAHTIPIGTAKASRIDAAPLGPRPD